MTAKRLNFEVDKFQLLSEAEDEQLSLLKLWIVSPGNNLHNLPISWETISDAKESLVGKPVLAAYDELFDKLKGHEVDENAIGVVLKSEDIFEEVDDNGRQWLCAYAYLWNKYYPREVEVLRKNDGKASVSMEIQILDGTDNGKGFEDIKLFSFMGVTILGTGIQPAIPGAKVDVLKFSNLVEETKEIVDGKFSKYGDIDFTIPEKVKKNAKNGLKIYGEKKSGANGFVLSIARHLLKSNQIEPSKVNKIYKALSNKSKQDVQKDGEAHISFMLLGGKEGLAFFKELFEAMENSDKNKQTHFSQPKETEEDLKKKTIQMEAPPEEETVKEEKMSEEEAPKEEEKPFAETPTEEEKEDPSEEKTETPEEEKKEQEKMSEEEAPKEEDEKEDVSMSLDAYADVSALMALLGTETEEYQNMSAEFAKPEKDFAKIAKGLYSLCQKYAEKCMSLEEEKKANVEKMQSLEKFKQDAEKEAFEDKVYAVLEEVKPFVSEEDLKDMKEKSANFSFEEIQAWEKDVKASMFTALSKQVQNKESDETIKIQFPFNEANKTNKKYIWS